MLLLRRLRAVEAACLEAPLTPCEAARRACFAWGPEDAAGPEGAVYGGVVPL